MEFREGALAYLRQNPAIGPVRVISPSDGLVSIKAVRGEERELRVGSAELRPFPLYPGMKVTLQDADGDLTKALSNGREILEVLSEDAELRKCRVQGFANLLDESKICPCPSNPLDPIDTLNAAEWRGPRRFFARLAIQETLARMYEDSDGIPTIFGTRARPLAHQLYASRRVLWDRMPRFIFADEVGLGKTIETGIVIQALCAVDPSLRVLIVAPGTMTRQWLCELYLRFGARAFAELSSTTWQRAPEPEKRRLLSSPRLIVSTAALTNHRELVSSILERDWHLVVVDEAHHFGADHVLYPVLRRLSVQARGFLALSATPSKRETSGMLSLLALVSPHVYKPTDQSALEKRLASRRTIWEALSYSVDLLGASRRTNQKLGSEELASIIEAWGKVLADDPVCTELLQSVAQGQTDAVDELVGYVQEFYRIDHRLIRTRRITLRSLGITYSQRQKEVLAYEESPAERVLMEHLGQLDALQDLESSQRMLRVLYHRFFAATPERFREFLRVRGAALLDQSRGDATADSEALLTDLSPEEEEDAISKITSQTPPLPGEKAWLKVAAGLTSEWRDTSTPACARFRRAVDWLREELQADPLRKILVFSEEVGVVESFAAFIRSAIQGIEVRAFHHGMTSRDLETSALDFQRSPKVRILVCDELGGEGRNFEIAWAVLHLDCPISVARVEQRIGRLDRVGRRPEDPVRSVILSGCDSVERFLLAVHTDTFCVHDRSLGGLEFALPRLQGVVNQAVLHFSLDSSVQALLAKEIAGALKETDEEFELSLDTSRPQLEKAKEVAEILSESDPVDFAPSLIAWLKSLGFDVRTLGNEVFRIKWEPHQLEVSTSMFGHNPDAIFSYSGTFSRARALENDGLQYFGVGHRLIDASLQILNATGAGRTAVFRRPLGPTGRKRVFLLVVARCFISGDFPAGLLIRTQRHLWPSAELEVLELNPSAEPAASILAEPQMRARIVAPFQGGEVDRKIELDELAKVTALDQLWAAVRCGVPTALQAIRERRMAIHEEAADALTEDLRNEMGYLRGVVARTQQRSAQAREELHQLQALIAAVREGSVVLDSLGVVVGA